MGDNYIHAASRLDERGIPVFGISGENILSRMNTTYLYSSDGNTIGENRAAGNVRAYLYPADLEDGTSIELACYFAEHDISPGAELRICYRGSRLERDKGWVSM